MRIQVSSCSSSLNFLSADEDLGVIQVGSYRFRAIVDRYCFSLIYANIEQAGERQTSSPEEVGWAPEFLALMYDNLYLSVPAFFLSHKSSSVCIVFCCNDSQR